VGGVSGRVYNNVIGLPLLRDNQAEGIVIKPMKEILITNKKGTSRAILKIKAKEFLEDQKYYEAQKWDRY
jgi:hypothetical protein